MKIPVLKKREEAITTELKEAPEVFYANYKTGLTESQVQERMESGCANTPVNPPSKSVKQIILSNMYRSHPKTGKRQMNMITMQCCLPTVMQQR